MPGTLTVNIMSYRYGHLAAQCVDSVLTQTRRPDVVRVFDDGVGDCAHIRRLYPDVEVVERPQNLGTVANFQDALDRTDTEFVMFIGADNWLRLDALELLMNQARDLNTYDLYVVGAERERFAARVGATEKKAGLRVWRFDATADMERTNSCHGSSLYRVDEAKKFGYQQRPGGARTEEDWHLFRRMLAAGCTRRHIGEPLMFYRRHEHNFNPAG